MTRPATLFLRQFWRQPRTIGAALPSSAALAQAMLAPIDFDATKAIVEFGPGTGPVTREIARRLSTRQRYLGIELNASFCRALEREFPALDFVEGSAEDLGRLLDARALDQVDAIVCGLPWASLPPGVQTRVFGEMQRHLRPGGVFVTFAYLQGLLLPGARLLKRRLYQEFQSVRRTPIVWRNFPPAFAYVCTR